MNQYTDARSRPGAKGASGTDDRQLFLTEFGGSVFNAYDEAMDYQQLRFLKSITQGKADSFPIIGRKRDATAHTPGDLVLGGTINHDEVQISLDNVLVDAVFIADVDAMMAHYELSAPYSHQIGQSLGSTTAKRIAIQHIAASRAGQTQGVGDSSGGQPNPAYYWNANLKTDGSQLELAAALAKQYSLQNDMSGTDWFYMLPHQQVLLLARYAGIEAGVTSGSADRSSGTVGNIFGLIPKGTNHIPQANVANAQEPKYTINASTTVGHISSKMAVGTLERRDMQIVMKEQPERIGTLIMGNIFVGHGPLRNECSIELVTDVDSGRGNGRQLLA